MADLISGALAINNSGVVVGTSQTGETGPGHAFLWRKGVMSDIGSLGGSAQPVAINERGDVVGSAFTSSGQQRAVLWTTNRHITG